MIDLSSVLPFCLQPECVEEKKGSSMAQSSPEQGAVGTISPEEDSPNMIVYRKVRARWCSEFST